MDLLYQLQSDGSPGMEAIIFQSFVKMTYVYVKEHFSNFVSKAILSSRSKRAICSLSPKEQIWVCFFQCRSQNQKMYISFTLLFSFLYNLAKS